MFTLGPMRGAHNAAMTMGYLWEGYPLPGPPSLREGTGLLPSGRGLGKPDFPISQPLLGAAGAPPGRGAVRQAHHRWGNPVSPYFHVRPHARGAQRQNENIIVLGRAQPSQTLPAGGLFPGRAQPSQTLPHAGYFHLSGGDSTTYCTNERKKQRRSTAARCSQTFPRGVLGCRVFGGATSRPHIPHPPTCSTAT